MEKGRIEKLILVQKAHAEVTTLRRHLQTIKTKYATLLDLEALETIDNFIAQDLLIPLEEQSEALQELCGLELD